MRQLADIAPLCGINVGGLQGCLRVFPVSNVLEVPRVVDGVHVGELTLVDAENYADLWFVPGLGEFTDQGDDDEQGDLFKQKLTVTVAKDAPDLVAAVARYRQLKYFVALFQDANGYTKLVGSKEWPLSYVGSQGTGQRAGDRNGHQLTFAVQSPQPAYFYNHFEVPAPGSRKVFSAGFSFGFQRT